jgi:hypothetical protein
MKKRVVTKIGDIFYVDVEKGKRYFQYIANDLTQLNSDVIRVFKKDFSKEDTPDYVQLILSEVDFHAHTMINIGVKQHLFFQTGKRESVSNINDVLFRGTLDYFNKDVDISKNWRIWHINDNDFTDVGELKGINRCAEIGIVIPPYAIIERIKTGKYNFSYPDFE